MSTLYTAEDSNKIDELLFAAPQEDNTVIDGAITEVVEEPDTVEEEPNAELFDNIKDIFLNNTRITNNKALFSTTKGNVSFNIDNTLFAPTPIVVLAGKHFSERYIKQLEDIIYTSKETLDVEKLFGLVYVVGIIAKGHVPIKLTSGANRKLLHKIVFTLNDYFGRNYPTLYSIYVMFSGTKVIPNTTQEQADTADQNATV